MFHRYYDLRGLCFALAMTTLIMFTTIRIGSLYSIAPLVTLGLSLTTGTVLFYFLANILQTYFNHREEIASLSKQLEVYRLRDLRNQDNNPDKLTEVCPDNLQYEGEP